MRSGVAAGREHSLVLGFDGVIHSWGSNKFGQLGHGDHQQQSEPVMIEYKNSQKRSMPFSQISAGDNHSAALCMGGRRAPPSPPNAHNDV